MTQMMCKADRIKRRRRRELTWEGMKLLVKETALFGLVVAVVWVISIPVQHLLEWLVAVFKGVFL